MKTMQIITGLNQHYKRNHIIQKYVQKANQHPFQQYIYICDNPHVIEQYFFQYTHCLVNIQIMTWKQYLKQLQVQYHLTKHHLVSSIEATYHLRRILKEETFHCFDMDYPLPFIKELFPLIKDYERYQINYPTMNHEKIDDFMHIYHSLLQSLDNETHLTIESIFNHVNFTHHDTLIIEADSLYMTQSQKLIERLSKTCEVICLYTYQDDERLFNLPYQSFCQDSHIIDQPNILTNHLFDYEPVPQQDNHHMYTFVAGTPYQEIQRVVYTIYQKVVDEKMHFRDFTIIYPQQSYRDDLLYVLDSLHIPHSLPHQKQRQYEQSYQRILQQLQQSSSSCFHDIAMELLTLDLDTEYIHYLKEISELKGHITPEEFKEFFQMTFPQTIQSSEKKQDEVHVCMIGEESYFPQTHLFILGMNETILPQSIKDTALLLDEDIELLRKQQISSPLTTSELLGIHQNHILKLLSTPYDTLTISYPMTSLTGETLLPSSLYKQLTNMFTFQKLPALEFLPIEDFYVQGGQSPDKDTLNKHIAQYQATKNQPVQLPIDLAQNLYSSYLSVSQIETYNKCPFLYFIQYGLGVFPPQEQKLMPNELGSLIHYVLSMTIDQEKDINHLVDQYIHDHDILQQKISQQPLNQFFIEQLTDDLHMTLKVLKYFLKTGHFQVEYKEKKVQDQIHDIAFKGFVDRIDTYDHYVSIIDYKSSAKNIDLNLAMQGFQIQMLIYLDMVTKMTQKDPGAVLYFNTKKRILSVQQNMNKPIEEDEWMKQYRYGGYVIDDGSHQSLLNLDPTFDKRSSLIPVTYVKSKDEYKGQILTIEQLHILFDKISEHIYELYQHMMEGHIEIAPKGSDQKATHTLVNPCFYCPYHSVCSFDVFYNDYQLVEFLDVDSILGGEEDAI